MFKKLKLNFPVDKREAYKLVSLTLLLFFLCVSSSILRNLKDSVTLTGMKAGAEAIPFLKVWAMLPTAAAMTWLFTFLNKHYGREKAFYIIIGGLTSFFIIFAFILFPNRTAIELTSLEPILLEKLPSGMKGLVSIICQWELTLFYVLCDIWPPIVLGVLFWGFTNEHSTPSEAERFYGILKLGSTSSAIAAACFASYLMQNKFSHNLPFGSTVFEQTLIKQILFITMLTMASFLLFNRLSKSMSKNSKIQNKKKIKISLMQSFRCIIKSRYILSIAVLLISYMMVYNLTDFIWKAYVREAFPNPNDLMRFMNGVTFKVGLISIVAAALSPWIVRKAGLRFLLLITPIVVLVLAICFFAVLRLGDRFTETIAVMLGVAPMMLIVNIGAVQNILSKAFKFSIFDISKETAFTPLDQETKWNAKATIDGMGTDIGDTGISLINQGFLIVFGSFTASAPYALVMGIIVLVAWISSANYIGREYSNMVEKQEDTLQ